MSLKVSFASLSLGASVDQQTGNLSVFEILEEIRTPQLPIHIQSMVISLAMEKKQPQDFGGKVLIHYLTPEGKQQLVGSGDMNIPAEQKRLKAVFRFGGFPVMTYGQHRFVLSFVTNSNQKVAESILDFDVIQVSAEAGPEQQGGPGTQH